MQDITTGTCTATPLTTTTLPGVVSSNPHYTPAKYCLSLLEEEATKGDRYSITLLTCRYKLLSCDLNTFLSTFFYKDFCLLNVNERIGVILD